MEIQIFWILIYIVTCFGQDSGACSGNRCGECITSGTQCAWCFDETYMNNTRCGTVTQLQNSGCRNVTTGPVSSIQFLRNISLNDGATGEAVQLYPQKVKIRLRPHETFKWFIKYKLAKNFPVDIYFLTDPSYTMRNLRDELARLAGDLATAIRSLTNDYRFGFGTTMDKVTLPFTHTTAAALQDPCGNPTLDCDPPHDFIHRYSFSNDTASFVSTVGATKLTANYDAPEGGFDGLMQVLVCTDRIGWRSKSRRLLLYATDSDFHFAGDGRLAGIVKPNDGACHLDGTGRYTHGLLQDYPSVGQLIKTTRDNNINLIFAITSASKALYEQLSQLIPEATTSELSSDSANILDIIKTNYENIRRSVELRYYPVPNDISVDFHTTCGGFYRVAQKTARCENITEKGESEIEFEVDIKSLLNSCPTDPSQRSQTFVISPVGLQEQIEIEVEYICECDCQKPENAEINSPRCNNGTGDFECGICHCHEGWSGDTCDCDERMSEEEACGSVDKNDNTTIKICNDLENSKCMCGKCVCPTGYTGDYCECYNAGCGFSNNEICGGPSRGVCQCGECKCEPGYTGAVCDCPVSTDSCERVMGGNVTICNGNGDCECGKCKCHGNYRGPWCQDCPTCPGFCAQFQPCAECKAFNQGSLTKEECDQQCTHTTVADKLDDKPSNVTSCQFPDSSGCFITFTYEFDSNAMVSIVVKKTKDLCPVEANVALLGGSIAGAIFLVALLLLIIWKILTTCYDSMEYARYQREIDNPDFSRNENPIFKPPVTKFDNPMCDANIAEKEKVEF